MKKITILIITFFINLSILYSNNIHHDINLNFSATPYLIGDKYFSAKYGLNAKFTYRFHLNNHGFEILTEDNYLSLNSKNLNEESFYGAYNILRAGVNYFHSFTDIISLSSGIHFLWYKSAIENKKNGIISKSLYAPSLYFSFNIDFPEYYKILNLFSFKHITQLDFLFENQNLSPYLKSILRFDIHPYFTYFSIFTEIGMLYHQYKDQRIEIDNPEFYWSTGISLQIKRKHSTKKKEIQKIKENIHIYRNILYLIKVQIKNSKIGDIIIINNIYVNENKTIGNNAKLYLEGLVDIMNKNPKLIIGISGNVKDEGQDNITLLKEAQNNAKIIRNELIKLGIDQNRISIRYSGITFYNIEQGRKPFINVRINNK